MEATGNGARKAATQFPGVSENTIKSWLRRMGAPTAMGAPTSAPGARAQRTGGRKEADKATVRIAKKPTDGPRTRGGIVDLESAPELARRLRYGAWGLTNIIGGVGDAVAARQRAETDRAKLRAAGKTAKEVDEACPLPPLPDMRQMDAGSRALRNLLDIAPGLASFDLATGSAPQSGLTDDEREALDSVMLAEGEPAGLTVVPGGRASTGGS